MPLLSRLGILTTALLATGCTTGDDAGSTAGDQAPLERDVMEVVARGLSFEAPDEVPSGWTTVRLRNESSMVHFAVVERMPQGTGLTAQQAEVAPVFQAGMDLPVAGDVDGAMAEFGNLPARFGKIAFLGDPGLTAAGETSEATVYLEPGTYLLECYVKTDGVFHSYNPDPAVVAMVHEFTVTGDPSGATEPAADITVALSAEEGMTLTGTPSPGSSTFVVEFVDQTVHENLVGHDVHLARLDEGAEMAELEAWMNWSQPGGLETPAPVTFIGGLNEMPAGSTGHFSASLEPGEYVLIVEVPGTRAKGLLQTFRVTD